MRHLSSIMAIVATLSLLPLSVACDLFGSDVPGPPPTTDKDKDDDDDDDGEKTTATTAKADEYRRPDLPIGARRDPFVFLPPKPEVSDTEEVERQREPLENFDINQLTLIAILTGTAVPRAMFKDPAGFGHITKEDDRIGQSGGRITDIRDNEVEVLLSDARIDPTDDDNGEPNTLIIRLSDTAVIENEAVEEGEGEDSTATSTEEILRTIEGTGNVPAREQP